MAGIGFGGTNISGTTEGVLDRVGKILDSCRCEPKSAHDISMENDMSLSGIYRALRTLYKMGWVRAYLVSNNKRGRGHKKMTVFLSTMRIQHDPDTANMWEYAHKMESTRTEAE